MAARRHRRSNGSALPHPTPVRGDYGTPIRFCAFCLIFHVSRVPEALETSRFTIEKQKLRFQYSIIELALSRADGPFSTASQTLPDLFPVLRSLIDARRDECGRYYLPGSVNPELIVRNPESLAGRVGIVELTPFPFSEIRDQQIQLLPNARRCGDRSRRRSRSGEGRVRVQVRPVGDPEGLLRPEIRHRRGDHSQRVPGLSWRTNLPCGRQYAGRWCSESSSGSVQLKRAGFTGDSTG